MEYSPESPADTEAQRLLIATARELAPDIQPADYQPPLPKAECLANNPTRWLIAAICITESDHTAKDGLLPEGQGLVYSLYATLNYPVFSHQWIMRVRQDETTSRFFVHGKEDASLTRTDTDLMIKVLLRFGLSVPLTEGETAP